jgi:hypothetical protein
VEAAAAALETTEAVAESGPRANQRTVPSATLLGKGGLPSAMGIVLTPSPAGPKWSWSW